MPVNALNNTSTKFEEVYLETSPTPTGGSSVIRRRAFSVPTLTVDTTNITYFLTLDPVDIKGSYAVMVKGSLNPKDINPTYKYSYLFEIYTCFNLNWAINSYPTTSYPTSGYFFNSLIIKNQTTEIQNVLNNTVTGTWDAYLKNYSATTSGLNTDTELYFYTVSGSWNMGTGRYLDSPQVDNGVSWNFRTTSGSGAWVSAGGDVNPSPVYSQSFAYSNPIDVNIQVTDTIHDWYSASVPNDGFLVRLTSSVEDSTDLNTQPIFKNFSIDTNTIYPPYLEIKFDDYSFNTGSI